MMIYEVNLSNDVYLRLYDRRELQHYFISLALDLRLWSKLYDILFTGAASGIREEFIGRRGDMT